MENLFTYLVEAEDLVNDTIAGQDAMIAVDPLNVVDSGFSSIDDEDDNGEDEAEAKDYDNIGDDAASMVAAVHSAAAPLLLPLPPISSTSVASPMFDTRSNSNNTSHSHSDSHNPNAATTLTVSPTKMSSSSLPGWRKPKSMPRRPLSAYNIFFKAERERIVEEINANRPPHEGLPTRRGRPRTLGIGFGGLARRIAERWKTADKAERGLYEAKAQQEKERYEREVALWRKEHPELVPKRKLGKSKKTTKTNSKKTTTKTNKVKKVASRANKSSRVGNKNHHKHMAKNGSNQKHQLQSPIHPFIASAAAHLPQSNDRPRAVSSDGTQVRNRIANATMATSISGKNGNTDGTHSPPSLTANDPKLAMKKEALSFTSPGAIAETTDSGCTNYNDHSGPSPSFSTSFQSTLVGSVLASLSPAATNGMTCLQEAPTVTGVSRDWLSSLLSTSVGPDGGTGMPSFPPQQRGLPAPPTTSSTTATASTGMTTTARNNDVHDNSENVCYESQHDCDTAADAVVDGVFGTMPGSGHLQNSNNNNNSSFKTHDGSDDLEIFMELAERDDW